MNENASKLPGQDWLEIYPTAHAGVIRVGFCGGCGVGYVRGDRTDHRVDWS